MEKVLIVDDTKNIRLLLTKCMMHEGYQVESADDGLEALELLRTSKFDLIFLDIKMPKLSGTEVLKCIREMEVHTPVIIITAYPTVKNAVECTKLGVVNYLQKPFTVEKIRSVLNELMSRQQDYSICKETENYLKEAKELLDTGCFSDSLKILKAAVSRELDNAELYLLISETYRGLGNQENAERFYKTYQLFKK